MSDGRKVGIKLHKIPCFFRSIARDFLSARSKVAMVNSIYFYYQVDKDGLNILKYFVLESGRGDVILSEMVGSVIDANITFKKVGSFGPRYDVIIPQLEKIVERYLENGVKVADARCRVGRDLSR